MKHVMEALPLGGVIFAYTGFSNALQLAGEVENPQKAIPLALLGTCLLTSILYLMLQVSFIGAFNPAELALGWQPVDIAAERGPFLVLLEQLKIHSFIPFIAIASCLSPFVAGLISLSGSARTLYALSEDKILPKSLMALHEGIPVRAVFINFVIGLMLLIPLPGWDRLIALLVSMIAFVYSIGPISMGTMRLTHKHLHRPFRVKAAHIVAFFALLSTNRIIFWSGAETVYLVCILALVFYAWCLFLKIDASDRFLEFKSSWWILAYVFMLASVAHFGNFGGNGTLTLHQQYSALSMITLIVYVLALASGRRRFRELNS
jgi:amino acid transporter